MSTRAERAARRAKQNDERHENERVYKALFNSLFQPDDEEIIDVVTVDDTLPDIPSPTAAPSLPRHCDTCERDVPPPGSSNIVLPKPTIACGTRELDVPPPKPKFSDFVWPKRPKTVVTPTLVVPQPANIGEALDYRDMPALEPNKT